MEEGRERREGEECERAPAHRHRSHAPLMPSTVMREIEVADRGRERV